MLDLSGRKDGVALDLVTSFRVCFVIGILAVPVLYLLLGRGSSGRSQHGARNENERVQRERRSEERGGSAEATE